MERRVDIGTFGRLRMEPKFRIFTFLFTLFLIPIYSYADQSLALRESSIVILTDAPEEITKHQKDNQFNEFSGDFAYYANRMISAFRKHRRWLTCD